MDETHQVNIHFNWDNLSLFSLLSSLYPYSLLIYSSLRAEWARLPHRFLPYVIFALKTCIPFVAVLKKSKKRQAKTSLLKIRSTPIALAALPADFSIFAVPPPCCNLRSKTDHSVAGCPKKVEKTSSENTTLSFFVLKPIIPLRAVPKKSKKRQAITPLFHFRAEIDHSVADVP